MIWETIWETGDDFCQKSIYSGKKIKSFFLVLESFKTCKKRSPKQKISPKCLLVNLNIFYRRLISAKTVQFGTDNYQQ